MLQKFDTKQYVTSRFRNRVQTTQRTALRACVLVASFGLAMCAIAPVTAARADNGSLLLNESFAGASVADSRAIGLDKACLTGASSAPVSGESNLGPCTETLLTPNLGNTPGFLQLTDNAQYVANGMVFNRALPSTAGMIVEFDQAQYGGNGADGIGFFLSDGSRELTRVGGAGGSLGYGPNTKVPGVDGGYIGVGLDAWGNYIGDYNGLGVGCSQKSPYLAPVANTVTLRGPGQGSQGYCLLAHSEIDAQNQSQLPGSLHSSTGPDDAIRNVRITVSPGTYPVVTVDIDFTGTQTAYQTVLSYAMTDPAPPSYKFGVSASTGDTTDVHLIRGLRIESVEPLGQLHLVKQVDHTYPQPDAYRVGDTVPFQFVVTNTGVEPLENIVVTDPLITNIVCPATALGEAGGAEASMVCTGSLILSAAQAAHPTGELTSTATATAVDSTQNPLSSSSEATVAVIAAHPALTLRKVAALNDSNANGVADLGETIDYSFTLTNTGDSTLNTVGVHDARLSGVSCETSTISPGESVGCAADAPYRVTEADLEQGNVLNTATGFAKLPDGSDLEQLPSDSTTTPTAARTAQLSLEAVAELRDKNNNGLAERTEKIEYTFTVTNTGNTTLSDVQLNVPGLQGVVCDEATLAPGASTTCVADVYEVTQADVDRKYVLVDATATATAPVGVQAPVPARAEAKTPTGSGNPNTSDPEVPKPKPTPIKKPGTKGGGVSNSGSGTSKPGSGTQSIGSLTKKVSSGVSQPAQQTVVVTGAQSSLAQTGGENTGLAAGLGAVLFGVGAAVVARRKHRKTV